jgi:uncharacterized protein
VIAVDTNLLVYAHREESPWHDKATECLRRLAEGPGGWAIPWPCVHEFFSIVTHPRIFKTPTPVTTAVRALDALFQAPGLTLLAEVEGYWPELKALVEGARITGPIVHDARIAALCVSHGVTELWSADRDFSRFPALVVRNPLVVA